MSFCPKCAYKCPCGSIHVSYCRIEGCNHEHVFKVPAKQTCEVWKDGILIALEQDRPIPLIRYILDPIVNPKSPYGSTHGVMLDKGIQVWRDEDRVSEIHPDGITYIWYNPTYLLNAFMIGDLTTACSGSFLRVFPDGSFKARIEAREYVWEAPILRTMDETISTQTLNEIVVLDYSRAPHPSSCECGECIYSDIKPIYYHDKEECNCINCADYGEDEDEDEYEYKCPRHCGCPMCDDCSDSVSTDSYMKRCS